MEAMFSCGRVAFAIITILCCFTSPAIACPFPERNLLLDFKAAVVDEYNTLTSWHGLNCCTWIGVSCNLRTGHVSRLDLSGFNLEGNISSSLFQLARLEHLDLSDNLFKGKFSPPHYRKLKSLTFLDLSFAGYVNYSSLDSVFDNLTRLNELYLSYNQLTVNIDSTWIPQFKLSDLALGSCNLDRIPSFLVTQYGLEYLDLSADSIQTNIPSWIWNLPSLYSLNLSCNQLTGSLPSRQTLPKYFEILDLHNNSLEGSLHLPLAGAYLVDLSMNQFNGSIPSPIGAYLENAVFLTLSRNNLSGAIPESICTPYLQVLDLSKNTLSSVIPPHLTRICSSLSVLDLAENHLEGKLPAEWGNITNMHTLKLNGNHLRGVIRSSISEGRSLQVLDLGNNDLEGTLPQWIGKLSQLHVLVLRSNHFHGRIPRQVIGLPNLQILDLSGNHLSGAIPSNLTNLLAIVNASQNNSNHLEDVSYTNKITISWKGWDVEFVKVLFILKCNLKLSGIPFTNISVCNNSSGYRNCTSIERIGEAKNSDGEMIGWAVGLGLSYGMGFSIVIGVLTLNKRVRKRAFDFYDVVILAIDGCIRG
ncbi:hypothetical protein SUGI_0870820 [Cryptomeria japonica]|nr:hypothetical protein SUGI_0870820 [Cryptomeria japonica]